MSTHDVDFFVIGGGSGGVRAARIAATHGAKVMLAEEYRMGGTCVIRGCVPKKILVTAAHYGADIADARAYGWTTGEPRFSWPVLIAAKDREIARLEAIYKANVEKAGGTVVASRAVVTGPHAVRLEATGETVTARHILVATGGHPEKPAFPGAELCITSNEAFHLPDLPASVVVQGGGYIAVEFAGIFAGLGARVTLVHRGDKVLRGFDEDLRDHLMKELPGHGVTLAMDRSIVKVELAGGLKRVTLSDGATLDVEEVMLATGRAPNTRGLGLEAVGVQLDAKGAVIVDADDATSVPSIHAVGDVTNRVNLTPVAIREGHALADRLFARGERRVDHTGIATAVFSDPELGTVGLTEAEACASHGDVDIYKATFRTLRHTITLRETRTLMKLVVCAKTDRVLGCHIAGEAAGEMIQMVAVALRMGATKADLDATVAVHPTAAEELVTLRTPTERHRKPAPEPLPGAA